MITTKIIRRIDGFDKISIPKQIRKALGIKEGDSFEISYNHDGTIILKKYDVSDTVEKWAQSIIKKWDCNIKGIYVDGVKITVLTSNGAFDANGTFNNEYNFSVGVAIALAKAYNEELPDDLKS